MTVTIIKALFARRPVLSSRVPIKISEVIKFSLFIQILTVSVSHVIQQTKQATYGTFDRTYLPILFISRTGA